MVAASPTPDQQGNRENAASTHQGFPTVRPSALFIKCIHLRGASCQFIMAVETKCAGCMNGIAMHSARIPTYTGCEQNRNPPLIAPIQQL
jgi:hypothetical protein